MGDHPVPGRKPGWSGYAIPDQFYNWLGGFEAARLTFFLLLMLASSLLALPVIIKGYSYRMTPWILADNPQIGYKRALKLSMQLTRGHKWGIFVLDLSFIGWFILGGLLCGIGIMFVMPYFQAVQAELYARCAVSVSTRAVHDGGTLAFHRSRRYLLPRNLPREGNWNRDL